jgi:transposase-like protein
MYLVAFGFFYSETHENWTWFMIHIWRAIGNLPLLAVSTDACRGLEKTGKDVLPYTAQRECFRHMMQNYVKRFSGGVEHMYPTTRAYRKVVHDHHLAIFREKPDVCYWLDTYHSLLWYRSGFNPEIKYDYVTNNITESFNNWIKDINDIPVCELADKIREKIMALFHTRRNIGCRLQGKILPSVLRVLKARTRGLCHLSLAKGDNYYVEV